MGAHLYARPQHIDDKQTILTKSILLGLYIEKLRSQVVTNLAKVLLEVVEVTQEQHQLPEIHFLHPLQFPGHRPCPVVPLRMFYCC